MTQCKNEMIASGAEYWPRTCPTCGISGKCHKEFSPGPYTTIKPYSNWCYLDSLDGTDKNILKDGDILFIRWPNGRETKEKIRVVKSSYEISDMGHPYTVQVSKAHVVSYHNGVETLVPIVGLEARRETV